MIIKDEALCGYEIHADSHGYSVFHPSVDENGEVRVDKNGRVMGSTKGYYATLTGCAQKIAKLATEEGLETTTLKEYIDKFNSIANQIEDAVK